MLACLILVLSIILKLCTAKPVLRGHLWDKENMAYKKDDL
jgi:hypothetical protein